MRWLDGGGERRAADDESVRAGRMDQLAEPEAVIVGLGLLGLMDSIFFCSPSPGDEEEGFRLNLN